MSRARESNHGDVLRSSHAGAMRASRTRREGGTPARESASPETGRATASSGPSAPPGETGVRAVEAPERAFDGAGGEETVAPDDAAPGGLDGGASCRSEDHRQKAPPKTATAIQGNTRDSARRKQGRTEDMDDRSPAGFHRQPGAWVLYFLYWIGRQPRRIRRERPVRRVQLAQRFVDGNTNAGR